MLLRCFFPQSYSPLKGRTDRLACCHGQMWWGWHHRNDKRVTTQYTSFCISVYINNNDQEVSRMERKSRLVERALPGLSRRVEKVMACARSSQVCQEAITPSHYRTKITEEWIIRNLG